MIPIQKVFPKTNGGSSANAVSKAHIKVPLCRNCRFYDKNSNYCTKFMYYNLVDGKETNVPAIEARDNLEMCGFGGVHFMPKIHCGPLIKEEDV
jgi:hypothetical protein